MPERHLGSRLLGIASAGLLAVVLTGPVAFAQTDPVPPTDDLDPGDAPAPPDETERHPPGSWGASSFESPFDEADETLRRATFDIEGTMRYEKVGPADFIDTVEVRVVGDPTSTAEGCSLPEPVTSEGGGPRPEFTAEHAFLVEDVTIPCNGRYTVEAEGHLEDPDADPHTMRQSFVLAALPESVTGLGVTLDGAERVVTATFQAPDALAPDAVGYVLERSGPTGGSFVDVASIGLDDELRIVDPLADAPAGTYTYRVRAVRAGPDGDVRSSIIHTESDTIEVQGQPTTSTSAPTTSVRSDGGTGGRTSGGRTSIPRTGTAPRLTTPTTLDTGFEETIDYGNERVVEEQDQELAGDEPLAGQSIVRDEGESMGLAIPAAGALVMLGWAGHILYLNRLAKQL